MKEEKGLDICKVTRSLENYRKEKEWSGYAPPQFQPSLAAAAITNSSTTTTLLPLLILRGRRVGVGLTIVSKNETMSQSEHPVHCHTILLLALLFLHAMENHPTNCNYNSLHKFIANCTPSTDTGTESTDTGLQDSSSFPAVDCVGTGQDVECAISSSSSEETQQQRTVGVELIQQQLQEWTVLVSPFFFWGTSMVAMKEVLPKAGPFFVSSFRLIPAGFLLIAFAAARGRPFPSGLTAWLSIALFGLVDAACFQGFLAEGLQRTSAGLGSVIIDSQPLTVAVLAALFLGESIAFLGAAGLVLGIIGLLLLEAPSLAVDGSNFSLWQSGEWWMLLAAQSMAVGTIMVRWVSKYSDPIMATGWHMVIGGLPLVMISILNHENAASGSLMNFTENDALALLYTSIFGSAISYGVYFYSATKGSLTKLSSLTFLTPMFASIFGCSSMGIRGRTDGDRLRTVWTPEMDRYFIDLMLEQVCKGNKFDDHLFSKRAWKHMTSLFDAKFKFPYEKDVLKNRHKTLRNLYKAVRNLLDQRGFSWDEMRQMVTADNNVWDEYIKVHPDARSFRIKTIPYYHDLCSIYGDTGIEERSDNIPEESSHSGENGTTAATQPRRVSQGTAETLQDIMVGEDYGVTVPAKSFDDVEHAMTSVPGITTNSRSRTYWQPPMDRYFIELMQEQVRKGSRIDGVFRKQAWMEMIASFNAKFGFNYDMDVLKNRHKTLKRQYNVIKNLLELDGFIWDDSRQMVTADDYVWQDYIKEHTDARQFMTRPVPYYKDLCMICDPSVDDRDSYSGQDVEQENQVEGAKLCGALTSFLSPSTSVSTEDEDGDVQESTPMCQKKRRRLENCPNEAHPKRSREEDGGMASALREMASAVSSLSEKRNDEKLNSGSIESVVEAVQALPDMDEDLVLDACDLLEDEKKAKTFMALDVKLRKKWLMRKLRPQ
ncbi:hypothetical protein GBA52_027911 [Prunus armeniaca]|nr:hypothetical protein GBA52_027911 [Prunus armeniaca]